MNTGFWPSFIAHIKFTLAFLLLVTSIEMHASSDQARHCFNSGDYVCAKNIWEPLAYKGDSIAQFYMARINQEGLGVAKNISNAQIWYVEAAESGLLEAQNNLAVLYEKGDGLPRDINKAIKWYTLAAEQGDTSAQYNQDRQGHNVHEHH